MASNLNKFVKFDSRFIFSLQTRRQLFIRSLSTNGNVSKIDDDPKPLKHYDVVIAGGGLVGTTLACAICMYFNISLFSDLNICILIYNKTFYF